MLLLAWERWKMHTFCMPKGRRYVDSLFWLWSPYVPFADCRLCDFHEKSQKSSWRRLKVSMRVDMCCLSLSSTHTYLLPWTDTCIRAWRWLHRLTRTHTHFSIYYYIVAILSLCEMLPICLTFLCFNSSVHFCRLYKIYIFILFVIKIVTKNNI